MDKLQTLVFDFDDGVTAILTSSGMLTFVAGGLKTNFVIPIQQAEEIIGSLYRGSNKVKVGSGHWSFEYVNASVTFAANNLYYRGVVKSVEYNGTELSPF